MKKALHIFVLLMLAAALLSLSAFAADNVRYVANAAMGTGDGLTAENATTLDKAFTELNTNVFTKAEHAGETCTIYLVEDITLMQYRPEKTSPRTTQVFSEDAHADNAVAILTMPGKAKATITFPYGSTSATRVYNYLLSGETSFDNVIFTTGAKGSIQIPVIAAQGHKLTLGAGVETVKASGCHGIAVAGITLSANTFRTKQGEKTTSVFTPDVTVLGGEYEYIAAFSYNAVVAAGSSAKLTLGNVKVGTLTATNHTGGTVAANTSVEIVYTGKVEAEEFYPTRRPADSNHGNASTFTHMLLEGAELVYTDMDVTKATNATLNLRFDPTNAAVAKQAKALYDELYGNANIGTFTFSTVTTDPVCADDAHVVVTARLTEASCTEGAMEYDYCSVCGKMLSEIRQSEHDYSGFTYVTEATCTEKATGYYYCVKCQDRLELTEVGEINPDNHDFRLTDGHLVCSRCGKLPCGGKHDYSGFTYVTEATCTKKATGYYYCTGCYDRLELTEVGTTVAHAWDDGAVVTAPTMLAEGEMRYTCKNCGATRTESIPALTTPALTLVAPQGAVPGETISVQLLLTCNPGIWSPRVGIAYDAERLEIVEVDNGDIYEASELHDVNFAKNPLVLSYDPHNLVNNTKDGTLATLTFRVKADAPVGAAAVRIEGYDAVDVNEKSISFSTFDASVAVHVHSYGAWTERRAASCTVRGEEVCACTVCGSEKTRTTAALGHDFAADFTIDTPSTCAVAGVKSRHCTRCDARTDVTAIPAGHTWGDGIILAAPTAFAEGEIRYLCKNCGTTRTERIPMMAAPALTLVAPQGAVPGDTVSVQLLLTGNPGIWDPTVNIAYDAERLEIVKVDNGDIYASSELYDVNFANNPLVLSYTSINLKNNTKDGTLATLTFRAKADAPTGAAAVRIARYDVVDVNEKSISFSTFDASVAVHVHSYGAWAERRAASCTARGEEVCACTVCGSEKTRTTAALGHDFAADFTIDTPSTCAVAGVKSRHCTRCDARTDVTVLPKQAHSYGAWTERRAASCTVRGEEVCACTVCGSEKTRTTAALGHDFAAGFTVDTPSTCTAAGVKSRHCTRCDGRTDVTAIAALGHAMPTEPTEPEIPPTVRDEGRTAIYRCQNPSCDYYTGGEVIPRKAAGDINADGEINKADLLRLQRHLAGWEVELDLAAADCNGDCRVNKLDLLRLQKYLAGWNVKLGQ